MSDTPHEYWCAVPELITANLSVAARRNLSIPFDNVGEMNKYQSKANIINLKISVGSRKIQPMFQIRCRLADTLE